MLRDGGVVRLWRGDADGEPGNGGADAGTGGAGGGGGRADHRGWDVVLAPDQGSNGSAGGAFGGGVGDGAVRESAVAARSRNDSTER